MATTEQKEKCKKWFSTLKIGEFINDIKHGRKNEIINITNSSVELFHAKVSNKGINCNQWYDIDRLADLTSDYNF